MRKSWYACGERCIVVYILLYGQYIYASCACDLVRVRMNHVVFGTMRCYILLPYRISAAQGGVVEVRVGFGVARSGDVRSRWQ